MNDEARAEIERHIARAAKHDIRLRPEDFVVIDGEPHLDGMDPKDWLDAMTMD